MFQSWIDCTALTIGRYDYSSNLWQLEKQHWWVDVVPAHCHFSDLLSKTTPSLLVTIVIFWQGKLLQRISQEARPFQKWSSLWYGIKTLPEAQRTQAIESKTWVVSAATRCYKVVPPDGVLCISWKFGHLHWLQIWPLGGTTCISCKVRHQVASLGLPHIALDCPIGIISWYWVGIFISQSHIINKVNKHQSVSQSDPFGPQVYLGR